MTTPSGTISMLDIINEFGANNPDPSISLPYRSSLGRFRVNQSIAGRNWPLDDGVPTPINSSTGKPNPISFDNLRGKTLNVVVDYSGGTEYNVNSADQYNTSGVVVGGYKVRPSSSSSTSKKAHHIIRTQIGATKSFDISSLSTIYFCYTNSRFAGCTFDFSLDPKERIDGTTYSSINATGGRGKGAVFLVVRIVSKLSNPPRITFAAEYIIVGIVNAGTGYAAGDILSLKFDNRILRTTINSLTTSNAFQTGSWGSNTILKYVITSTGVISGAGGDGGNGAGQGQKKTNGSNGGNAFFANVPCTLEVEANGRLQGGGGGGGGGGSSNVDPDGGGTAWDQLAGGSGGGGGYGIPPGVGGIGGNGGNGGPRGNDGAAGKETIGGNGGNAVTTPFPSNPQAQGGGGGGGSFGGKGGASVTFRGQVANPGQDATSTAGGKGGNGKGGAISEGTPGGTNGLATSGPGTTSLITRKGAIINSYIVT